MRFQYGFIGTGNMGSALLSAVVKEVPAKDIMVANRTREKAEKLAGKFGCACGTNEEVVRDCRFVVLGVKPQMLEEVLTPLQTALAGKSGGVLVTMAAGVSMERLCRLAGGEYPVIRIMPNTPVSVGAGVLLATHNDQVSEDDFRTFLHDFSQAGLVKPLAEDQIDAASVISGCGPAYVYMFMDAMAKAGVKLGLSYETAAELAEAMTRGSALLSENSSATLEDLRIAVCSPGGSTIEGVKSFWDADLDGVTENALRAAYDRTKELAGD